MRIALLLSLPLCLLAGIAASERDGASATGHRIEVGDRLRVWVLGHPALSTRRARVAVDGTVELPKVGRAPAAGLTTRELAKAVEAALDRYVTYRNTIVIVQWIETPPDAASGAQPANGGVK